LKKSISPTDKLDVSGGETEKSAFLAVNPKGKVPVLMRDDGSTVTEFGAIAAWLAMTHPNANLLPPDPETQMRVREAMDYTVGTIHGQGFARIFMPAKFEPQDVVHKMGLGSGSVCGRS
jgi:glutathione S-transferase